MPFPLLLCQREQKFWRNFEALLRDAEPLLCLGTRNPPPVPTQQHRGARRQQKLRHELHGWGWAAPCGATRCRAVPPCDDTRCRAVPPGATWCHPAGPNASSDSASPWAHGQGQVALVGHETWAPAGTKISSGAACPHSASSLLPVLCPWEQPPARPWCHRGARSANFCVLTPVPDSSHHTQGSPWTVAAPCPGRQRASPSRGERLRAPPAGCHRSICCPTCAPAAPTLRSPGKNDFLDG